MTRHRSTRSTSPPDRSLEQRLAALERANAVRTHRKQLKRDLKAGRVAWSDVLDDDDVQTMRVIDLLLNVPKFGRVKVNRILSLARVSPTKTVGGLTARQRVELVELVRAFTPAGGRSTGWPYPRPIDSRTSA